MSLRRFASILCILLTAILLGNITTLGQDIPEEYINIWEHFDSDSSRVLSIFSDGSYIFYTEERSTEDSTDENCERTVEVSRGTVQASRRRLTLTPVINYRIDYPACGLRIDAELSDGNVNATEFSLDFDDDTKQLSLDDNVYTGHYAPNHLVQSVETSLSHPIPEAFVASWTSDFSVDNIEASSLLRFSADGTYFREYSFMLDDSQVYSSDAGEAVINDLLLYLEPQEGKLIIDEDELPLEVEPEYNVIWLAFEEEEGLVLYINGLPNFFDANPSPIAEPTATEETSSLLFDEDFVSNDVSWEEGSETGYDSEFRDGVYVLDFNRRSDITNWIVSPGFTDWSVAPLFAGSYTYQFEMRGSCDDTCGIGMVVGLEEAYRGGTVLLYWPLDNGVGWYRVYDYRRDNLVDEGAPLQRLDVLDGEWHSLRLEVSEDTMSFFIDNQAIANSSGSFDSEGTIGFYMSRDNTTIDVEFEIDNLSVR